MCSNPCSILLAAATPTRSKYKWSHVYMYKKVYYKVYPLQYPLQHNLIDHMLQMINEA